MLSGHVEGQALKFLVALAGATRVLEIGMFTGYSALAMAEALPPGGELVACELDPDVAAFAERCFAESPSGNMIAVEVGPALATLGRLAADLAASTWSKVNRVPSRWMPLRGALGTPKRIGNGRSF